MMTFEKYSLGIGDRFGWEGEAQLRALQQAAGHRVHVTPVWNKSNREHLIIGSSPEDTRQEADSAVRALGWQGSYFVDADHIGLGTVDRFLQCSNWFTIDVADFIGTAAEPEVARSFFRATERFKGDLVVSGIAAPVRVDDRLLESVVRKYLGAVVAAGKVYRHIEQRRGAGTFVTEISLDEADLPQTPAELFFILAAIALEGVPVHAIAPKFSGAFLKGVDYVGDIATFAREFREDIAVIAFAVKTFDLEKNLRLSVHSGSDKPSLYPLIHRALKETGAGLHVKTAGTTWLEELIGLAEDGGDGLRAAKRVYAQSYLRSDELCKPYLSVVNIDRSMLPPPEEVESWTSEEYTSALRHDQTNDAYNVHFRQLLHVGYKVAAEMGPRFDELLREHREMISRNVTDNLYRRHLLPLYVGAGHDTGGRKS